MALQEVQLVAEAQGYRVQIEDTSLIDSTPAYVIYKGFNRIIKFRTIAAVYNWLTN